MARDARPLKPTGVVDRDATTDFEQPVGTSLVHHLLEVGIVPMEDWERLPSDERRRLSSHCDREQMLARLVELGLLTEYQADRVGINKLFGLVLGNYRVLERLGAGAMGVVFKGAHVRLRQPVAIKVLPLFMSREQSSRNLKRFCVEINAAARIRHPNIVRAIDAGEVVSDDPADPVLHYYVMDYVDGEDLEQYVERLGPLGLDEACDLICQVASALQEAHVHHMVHRDIKPSNIRVTPERRAMLLDFGLVRHFRHRMTEPGTFLGTLDYIAPEQAYDASAVDIRADIYGLGATLYWCLTGRPPFEPKKSLAQEMLARQTQPPPSVRNVRSEVPEELDAVIRRMMAPNPADRYATPQAVIKGLIPFINRDRLVAVESPLASASRSEAESNGYIAGDLSRTPSTGRVLIVDDDAYIRNFCTLALKNEQLLCDHAGTGEEGLSLLQSKPFDLVLLDVHLPDTQGPELLRQIRENPPAPNLKVIIMSGEVPSDELAEVMLAGSDDFLIKPFTMLQLLARVKGALRLREAQNRSDLLTRHLVAVNHQLEQNLSARDSDLVHARNALVLALAELVARRDTAAPTGHLQRVQRYVRILATAAAGLPAYASQIDPNFIDLLECCAPLKDIGKVALPDHILFKPGKLDPDERIIMQSHTVVGAETLEKVARHHGASQGFLHMAVDIVRHHHERFDGKGYPDRIAGTDIPLAARIVAIADVYDALRSRRMYRPSLSHGAAMEVMLEASPGQFDPGLLQVFHERAGEFERVFAERPD